MQLINEQIGNYTLKRELGRGGMGVIYAAEDQILQRQVAIKIMLPSTHPDVLQRFYAEMKAIGRLNHKHIVHLYSYGEAKIKETTSPGKEIIFPYIVMPLYKDGSLDKWLQKAPPLTLDEIAYIISQAADALQHAHDHGIVHRDVKPPNFLLSFPCGKTLPDIFLADFGIAKIADATTHLTQTGDILGSPPYLAPEQWDGLPLDCA